jgi:hypothetical protein
VNKDSKRPITVGDWVTVLETGEKGIVERASNNGDQLFVKVPRSDGWPFPKWVSTFSEKVKRVHTPKPQSSDDPLEEAPF